MRFPERFRSLCAVAALGMFALVGAAAAADPAPDPPSALGRRVLERYEASAIEGGIRLWPHDEGSTIRSIEITDDDEVVINGKEFDAEEAADFLGRDGELVRELVELDVDGRRDALGLGEREETAEPAADEEATADEEAAEGHVRIDVPTGVPGAHFKVRVSGDDRVSVGKSIHLGADESARDVVCIGCSIDIEGSAGEAVAVGGSVRVTGTVDRDVTAVGGSVDVLDGGVVGGDAVAIGGTVETHDSGRVEGQNTTVGIGGPWFRGWSPGWRFPWGAFDDLGAFMAAAIRTGMLALLAVLAVMLARPTVDRMSLRVSDEPWKAAFSGLLTQLLILPLVVIVVVVLAISIIGIPLLLLVPFALLAFAVGWFVGFVAVARLLGAWAERRFGWQASSLAIAVVVGVVLIQGMSLVGRLFSLPGGAFAIVGFTLVGLGFFLKYVAWTIGLGAMTLVALSGGWRRRGNGATAAVPPPPPAPPAPVEPESSVLASPPPPPSNPAEAESDEYPKI